MAPRAFCWYNGNLSIPRVSRWAYLHSFSERGANFCKTWVARKMTLARILERAISVFPWRLSRTCRNFKQIVCSKAPAKTETSVLARKESLSTLVCGSTDIKAWKFTFVVGRHTQMPFSPIKYSSSFEISHKIVLKLFVLLYVLICVLSFGWIVCTYIYVLLYDFQHISEIYSTC